MTHTEFLNRLLFIRSIAEVCLEDGILYQPHGQPYQAEVGLKLIINLTSPDTILPVA